MNLLLANEQNHLLPVGSMKHVPLLPLKFLLVNDSATESDSDAPPPMPKTKRTFYSFVHSPPTNVFHF
jgi:hypothetical protein